MTMRPWRSAKWPGDEPPAARVDDERAGHVEDEGDGPDRGAGGAVELRPEDQGADPDGRAGGQAGDGVPEGGIVPAGQDEQHDVGRPDCAVGDGEDQAEVAVGFGHAQGCDQQCGHRREEDEAHGALVGVHHARQPGVAHPRPPQEAENEQPPADARPRRVVGHQGGALGDGQHEDEIEEQLEGADDLPAPKRHP
jgi:hypothetical protein